MAVGRLGDVTLPLQLMPHILAFSDAAPVNTRLRTDAGLRELLAAATDKLNWFDILSNALGDERQLTCTHNETLFRDCPLTGAMLFDGKDVTSWGSPTDDEVSAAVDLSTGTATMRVSGGGHWIEGTLGLGDADRNFLFSEQPSASNGIGFGPGDIRISAPAHLPDGPPVPENLITTIDIINDGGAASAGFISPTFGIPFKQGDMPSGQYPAFFVNDDTPCHATIWGETSWPDGSMKFCGAMIRVPADLGASESVTISVKSGGSKPLASNRSTSDLFTADLSVEMIGSANLSGTWIASLSEAIAAADDIVLLGDGQAGAYWRIGGEVKDSNGDPHAHLYCWHYVMALQDDEGDLYGVRYLGRVVQPWGNKLSPAPQQVALTAALKSGGSTIRTLQCVQSNLSIGDTISMPFGADFFTCGTDGRYDYIQAGGSRYDDGNLRVEHNKTKFVTSRLVPPYDIGLAVNSALSVDYNAQCKGDCENYATGGTGERREIGVLPSWAVIHLITQSSVDERAVRVSGLASGGWRVGIRRAETKQPIPVIDIEESYAGLGNAQPAWRYWSNGSGVNTPTAPYLWSGELESHHRPSMTYYPYLISGEQQYLDLLVEQAAQLLLSQAVGGNVWKTEIPISGGKNYDTWNGDRNATIGGILHKGAGIHLWATMLRFMAWGTRDMAQAAAIYPDACPFGTEIRKYLRDVLASAYAGVDAYNNALPQSWRDSGLVSYINNRSGAGDDDYESPWTIGYLSNSLCHQSMILPDVGAQNYRSHIAKMYASIHAAIDIRHMTSYRWSQWIGPRLSGVKVVDQADATFYFETTLNFSQSTHRATITGGHTGWTPTAGDVIQFPKQPAVSKPFDIDEDVRLYIVNPSGNTFQLSETPGGAPIEVTSAVTVTTVMARIQNCTDLSFEGATSPGSTGAQTYFSNIYSALRHHQACGDTIVTDAREVQDSRMIVAGTSFAGNPKNAMAAAYPEE